MKKKIVLCLVGVMLFGSVAAYGNEMAVADEQAVVATEAVSGNAVSGNAVSGDTVSGNTVAKKKQTIKIKKTYVVEAGKTQKFNVKISGNKTKATFKKVKGNKKITLSKAGKVTVKKGLKKGSYNLKLKVTAKTGKVYKSAIKTATIKIKVK